MAKIKSSINEEPNDSFTSMIDIVFLLLIFFILQPFKQPETKLRSELPKDEGPSFVPPANPRPHIVVRIERDASNTDEAIFKVGGREIGNSANNAGDKLSEYILQESKGDLDSPVAIMPDLHVNFKHVLKALDQCHKARMGNIKFDGPPLANYVPGQPGPAGR